MGDAVAHLPGADHPNVLNIQRHDFIRLLESPVPASVSLRSTCPYFYAELYDGTTRATANLHRWSTLHLFEFCRQFRQRLIEIGNSTIVGTLEDRRLLVLVDSNNHFGVFHPCEMLDRTRNSYSDVEFGRHHLAGLPDLPVIRRVTSVDCST